MNIIEHLFKVAKSYLARITCKHSEVHVGSCPFTGYTYTICNNCMKYIDVKVTE